MSTHKLDVTLIMAQPVSQVDKYVTQLETQAYGDQLRLTLGGFAADLQCLPQLPVALINTHMALIYANELMSYCSVLIWLACALLLCV